MLKACILFWTATILGPLLGASAFANVIGADDRRPITEAYQALGFDMVDMLRTRQSTGFVYCPGTVYGNPLRTSGALVNDNQVVVTNGHSFVDEHGRRREPLSECYFQTQGMTPEVMRFNFTAGNFEMTEDWAKHRDRNDYAVVRLLAPLKYGRAFPLAAPEDYFRGRSFVLVSAKPHRRQAPFTDQEPIVQSCQVRHIFEGNSSYNTVFKGDCDVSVGASGSVGLVNVNGRWKAFSVVSGRGIDQLDGQPYSLESGSFSFHTPYRDGLLAAILRLSR